MNIAPGPQEQIQMVSDMLHDIDRFTLKALLIGYNSFANVAGYQLPRADRFKTKTEAKAALTRLHDRLHELFGIPEEAAN
jgi:hypothetical protein